MTVREICEEGVDVMTGVVYSGAILTKQSVGSGRNDQIDRNVYTLFGGCFILSKILRTISDKWQLTLENEFNDQGKHRGHAQIY